MTDADTKVACRAALLTACHYRWTSLPGNEGAERLVVDVDDAAACMARYGAECLKRGRTRTMLDEIEERDQLHLAALAAAQEAP